MSLEIRMSDWFMDFFNEQENIDNTPSQNRLLVLLENIDFLLFLLVNLTKRVYNKTLRFTYVNTSVKIKPKAHTFVKFTDKYTFLYIENVISIVCSIILSIFEKFFFKWIIKQLII